MSATRDGPRGQPSSPSPSPSGPPSAPSVAGRGAVGGRWRAGEPRVRRPAAAADTEPLAEGGFVLHRLVLFGLALVLSAALAPAALAARVHVRVEGKTTTIFGAPEPFVAPAATPLEALEDASVLGEFFYHVKVFSFGPFVDQIGRYPSSETGGWLFKVNGVLPQVGADK